MNPRRALLLAPAAAVLALALAACIEERTAETAPATSAGPPADVPAMAAAVVAGVNELRVEAGLSTLAEDPALAAVAAAYSCQMAAEGFFSHADLQGLEVDDRVKAAGIAYRQVGENLARNSNAGDPVAVALDGWMESESHRANILRPGFTETGAGVCRTGETYYFTQLFLQPQ